MMSFAETQTSKAVNPQPTCITQPMSGKKPFFFFTPNPNLQASVQRSVVNFVRTASPNMAGDVGGSPEAPLGHVEAAQ